MPVRPIIKMDIKEDEFTRKVVRKAAILASELKSSGLARPVLYGIANNAIFSEFYNIQKPVDKIVIEVLKSSCTDIEKIIQFLQVSGGVVESNREYEYPKTEEDNVSNFIRFLIDTTKVI